MFRSSPPSSLSRVQGWVIDMDGVLYHDTEPVPGAAELLAAFTEQETPFTLLTNNSSLTPAQYAAKLAAMGIVVSQERILTSALATADYLDRTAPEGSHVYGIGGDGLFEALAESKMRVTPDYRKARYVVVGLNRRLTFQHLQDAVLAIGGGAEFIATNPDLTLPTPLGQIPGNGAIVAAIQAATGREPVVIGKPEPGIFHWACRHLGLAPHNVACLGDRLETDILGGQRAGMITVFVLTGISTEAQLAAYEPKPTASFRGMADLLDAWRHRPS